MVKFSQKPNYKIEDLIEIVRLLRAPGGCPWDREQTHTSIRQNFIEEVYEAIEAIDTSDTELLREELGDVLLQVVMHTQMEKEQGNFEFDDIVDGVCKKLIIRHPHVFGDTVADNTETVLKNWDSIKMQTKSQKTTGDAMKSVSKALPSLMRSEKLLKKASKQGMAFNDAQSAFKRTEQALIALKQASVCGDIELCSQKLGELLMSVVDVSGCLHIDCEKSLYHACDGFTERFIRLEKLAAQKGINIQNLNPQDLDLLWSEIKPKEKVTEEDKK